LRARGIDAGSWTTRLGTEFARAGLLLESPFQEDNRMRRFQFHRLRTLALLSLLVGFTLAGQASTTAQAKFWISQGGAIGETTVVEVDASVGYATRPYVIWMSLDYLAWPPTQPIFAGFLDDQGRTTHRIPLAALPSLVGTRIELSVVTSWNLQVPRWSWLTGRLRWVLGAPGPKRFHRGGDIPTRFANRLGCARCVLKDGTLLQTGRGIPAGKVKLPYPSPMGPPPPVPPLPPGFYPALQAYHRAFGVNQDHYNEALRFDPSTGLSRSTGLMHRPRFFPEVVALPDGTALVVGGDPGGVPLPPQSPPFVPTAEVFDPSTGSFRFLGTIPFWPGCSNLLLYGRPATATVTHPWTGHHYVLFAGVQDATTQKPACYLYDVQNRTFSSLGGMIRYRSEPTAVALPSGVVFIAGGWTGTWNNKSAIADAELFEITTRQFYPAGKMSKPRFGHAMAALGPAHVLISGGQSSTASRAHDDLEVFDGTRFLYRPTPFRLRTHRRGHQLIRRSVDTFWVVGGEEYVGNQYIPTISVETLSPRGVSALPPIPAEQPCAIQVYAPGSGRLVAFNDFEYFVFR